MKKPLLILLSGLPASGKSTIGNTISRKFNFPLIEKDMIKEILADSMHQFSKEDSIKFGKASRELSYKIIEKLLTRNISCILEGNFYPERDDKLFQKIQSKSNCIILQILVKTEKKILINRFKNRFINGERHKIHLEHHMPLGVFTSELSREILPELSVDSKIIEIDTTDFNKVDWEKTNEAIEKMIHY